MSNHDYALPSGLPHAYDSRQYSTNSGAKIMYGSPQIMPYQLSPTLNTGTLGGNGHSGQHEDSQLPYDQDWNNTGSSASSPNRQSSTNNVSSAPPTNAGGQKKASSRNRSAMACLLCRKQKVSRLHIQALRVQSTAPETDDVLFHFVPCLKTAHPCFIFDFACIIFHHQSRKSDEV